MDPTSAQLLGRRWLITDANDKIQEVPGRWCRWQTATSAPAR